MQQQTAKDEIGKCALVRNAFEIFVVLRVRLHAQACGEDELADGCAKAREEGVEGLGWV